MNGENPHHNTMPALIDAQDHAFAAGWPENRDFNAVEQEGVGFYQVTQKNGERMSAAKAYLTPHLDRANLAVLMPLWLNAFSGNKDRSPLDKCPIEHYCAVIDRIPPAMFPPCKYHGHCTSLWLLVGLLGAWSVGPQAATLQATVVRVIDGDSFVVADGRHRKVKLRLSGIDAPEKNQPSGRQATASLAALALGKTVTVEWHKRDAYGRVIGQALVAPNACPNCSKNIDVGLAQITAGYAWWYRSESRDQSHEDKARYAFAENAARARHLGLWSAPEPVAPWQWRHSLAGQASSSKAWTSARIKQVKAVVVHPGRSLHRLFYPRAG